MKTGNPAELSTALVFATIYSVVVFLSAAVSDHFGETMLYPVAVLSGLTDVDAITLSIAHLYQNGRATADVAWRVVFVASLANLVFKTGVVGFVGGAELRRRLVPLMGILIVTGSVGAALWPR